MRPSAMKKPARMRSRASERGEDEDEQLRQAQEDRQRHDAQRDDQPHQERQEARLEADPRHDADTQLIADEACQQHDRCGIEEIGEHGGEDRDEQPDYPTDDGREEALPKDVGEDRRAELEAGEEPPDGQQNREETVAREAERQPHQDEQQRDEIRSGRTSQHLLMNPEHLATHRVHAASAAISRERA